MRDDLIDDEVRKYFPGMTDEEIYSFYEVGKKAQEDDRPTIFQSDLSHAEIIRSLGWVAFKEYLRVTVGTDYLDDEDLIALTRAVSHLNEVDNVILYGALYRFAAEPSQSKTVSARKQSYEALSKSMNRYAIEEVI